VAPSEDVSGTTDVSRMIHTTAITLYCTSILVSGWIIYTLPHRPPILTKLDLRLPDHLPSHLNYALHVFELYFNSLGGSLLSTAISRTRTHKPRFHLPFYNTTGLQSDLKIKWAILLLLLTCVHYLFTKYKTTIY